MLSPRHRSLRHRPAVRAVVLVGALALLAACSTNVAGSPGLPSGAAATSGSSPAGTTASPGGQITEPSVLPGQSTTSTPDPTSSAGGNSAATAPATQKSPAPVPKGLESFYSQKLKWQGCSSFVTVPADATLYADPSLECTRLTVPMVYADPTGPTIQIGVLRKAATDPSARIGSLVTDPGGPGVSGMEWAAELGTLGIAKALNQRFDLVGIDPRGVGSSIPTIQCQTNAQLDASRAKTPRSNTQAAIDASNQQLKDYANGCVTLTGTLGKVDGKTFLANVGTRDVGRDLDVLRAALGDSKLTYAGFSYGTQIGYVYAEEFPTNVRAMILDGAVDPTVDPATDALTQLKGFQDAFVTFAGWCVKRGNCALGTDAQNVTTAFQNLTRPLLDKPIALADGRVLSYSDATLGASEAMYDNESWPTLADALTALKNGDGSGLMALADQYYDRDSSGNYGRKPDPFNAIRCLDNARMTDPADVIKLNTEEAKTAPFEDSGDPPADIPDLCAYWPVPPTLEPHQLKVPGLPKVVVVSTTGDPATPYQNGVDLAKQLGASLITYQGTRHAAYLVAGSACVNDAGNNYLINLTQPADGLKCS